MAIGLVVVIAALAFVQYRQAEELDTLSARVAELGQRQKGRVEATLPSRNDEHIGGKLPTPSDTPRTQSYLGKRVADLEKKLAELLPHIEEAIANDAEVRVSPDAITSTANRQGARNKSERRTLERIMERLGRLLTDAESTRVLAAYRGLAPAEQRWRDFRHTPEREVLAEYLRERATRMSARSRYARAIQSIFSKADARAILEGFELPAK